MDSAREQNLTEHQAASGEFRFIRWPFEHSTLLSQLSQAKAGRQSGGRLKEERNGIWNWEYIIYVHILLLQSKTCSFLLNSRATFRLYSFVSSVWNYEILCLLAIRLGNIFFSVRRIKEQPNLLDWHIFSAFHLHYSQQQLFDLVHFILILQKRLLRRMNGRTGSRGCCETWRWFQFFSFRLQNDDNVCSISRYSSSHTHALTKPL